ncbi:hypothetical protein FW320_18250 [Azospirillum sp. Vi22]|nr:hypothetical protein [Azospirillum baldaniorum]
MHHPAWAPESPAGTAIWERCMRRRWFSGKGSWRSIGARSRAAGVGILAPRREYLEALLAERNENAAALWQAPKSAQRRVAEPEGPRTPRSGRLLCPLSRTSRRRFRSVRGW